MTGASQTVVVLGGTGFLGRRVVRHLLEYGFAVRVAVRHPEKVALLFPERSAMVTAVRADVEDETSITEALAGAWGLVNAVSLYVETDRQTFHGVHVEAAARVAAIARRAGVQRLIQMSGLGADPHASSGYIRSRGLGEGAVGEAFPGAVMIRPSAMFAAGGGFIASIAGMLRIAPVFPQFGTGGTRLQPACVGDVAEAISRILAAPAPAAIYEFGGPEVLTYKALLQTVARRLGLHRIFLPVPFALWRLLAILAEWLPSPPITTGMVALMEDDNVVSGRFPGFEALGIAPKALETVIGGENG